MQGDVFARALFGPNDDATHVVAAGVRKQIASAMVRDMLHDWRRVPSDLRALFSGAGDVYATLDDPAPGLWQVLSYSLVFSYRRRMRRARSDRSDLVAAHTIEARDVTPPRARAVVSS